MNTSQLIAIFESCVMVIALAVLCLKLVAGARLLAFRQEMFEIRDELFDYAAAGNIRFNDPAYRLLRQSMNGFIRYAHELTFFRLCMTEIERRVFGIKPSMAWHDKWRDSLANIKNQKVKDRLCEFHLRSSVLAVRRVVSGSPLLFGGFMAVFTALVIRDGWHNIKRICNRAAEVTLSKIVDTNSIEENAAARGAVA
jgi:hypothetical protein